MDLKRASIAFATDAKRHSSHSQRMPSGIHRIRNGCQAGIHRIRNECQAGLHRIRNGCQAGLHRMTHWHSPEPILCVSPQPSSVRLDHRPASHFAFHWRVPADAPPRHPPFPRERYIKGNNTNKTSTRNGHTEHKRKVTHTKPATHANHHKGHTRTTHTDENLQSN